MIEVFLEPLMGNFNFVGSGANTDWRLGAARAGFI